MKGETMKDKTKLAEVIFGTTSIAQGSELCAEDQKRVLSEYVHRFTRDHKPKWAADEWKDGKPYPVQFASDADWLANSWFAVRKDGRLDERKHSCYSSPTWPENPELRPVEGGAK
jgi:hypothetical protein